MIGGTVAGVVGLCIWGIRQTKAAATPAEGWKWGVIYYNPSDPSLWVVKRYGLGWTLNFANRWSWIVLIIIAFIPMVAIALAR